MQIDDIKQLENRSEPPVGAWSSLVSLQILSSKRNLPRVVLVEEVFQADEQEAGPDAEAGRLSPPVKCLQELNFSFLHFLFRADVAGSRDQVLNPYCENFLVLGGDQDGDNGVLLQLNLWLGGAREESVEDLW